MSGWRLFVAGLVPAEACHAVWDGLADMRQRYPEVRWIPAEQMHVTLVFLGSTDPASVPGIADAMRSVVARHPPAELVTAGTGGRADDRRGGVCWLRLAGPGTAVLGRLARDLDETLPPTAGRGRVHAAHLTVCRRVSEAVLADLRAPAISFVVDRAALIRSHTGPGGARYEELAAERLGGLPGRARSPRRSIGAL